MTVHLEGMGWLGSVLAYRLDAAGIDFTWNDIHAPYAAWRASTGGIYPAGDERSRTNLARWETWHSLRALPAVQKVAFCYINKQPPHGGKYPVKDLGWLRVADAPCFTVDVPTVVQAARSRFTNQRLDAPPTDARRVVSHGFSDRSAGVLWGWSAPVRLEVPDELYEATEGLQPMLYGRAHRFQLVYAYPMASRPGWWKAGSAILRQNRPRNGDPVGHLKRWIVAARTLYPKIEVLEAGTPSEGWRPRPLDPADRSIAHRGSTIVLPTLGHSGVRWAPEPIEATVDALR